MAGERRNLVFSPLGSARHQNFGGQARDDKRSCQSRHAMRRGSGGEVVFSPNLWYILAMRIDYTLLIFKEGTTLVSFCPELSVSSCGDTVEEARKRDRKSTRLNSSH